VETIKTLDHTQNDLLWKIDYDPNRCTQCGSCVAACSFNAIEAKMEKRTKVFSSDAFPNPQKSHSTELVIIGRIVIYIYIYLFIYFFL
jgi:glutamate synthase (NADPH/NADH) large chain